MHAKELINLDINGVSDPYVKITFPDGLTKRTKEINGI